MTPEAYFLLLAYAAFYFILGWLSRIVYVWYKAKLDPPPEARGG